MCGVWDFEFSTQGLGLRVEDSGIRAVAVGAATVDCHKRTEALS